MHTMPTMHTVDQLLPRSSIWLALDAGPPTREHRRHSPGRQGPNHTPPGLRKSSSEAHRLYIANMYTCMWHPISDKVLRITVLHWYQQGCLPPNAPQATRETRLMMMKMAFDNALAGVGGGGDTLRLPWTVPEAECLFPKGCKVGPATWSKRQPKA